MMWLRVSLHCVLNLSKHWMQIMDKILIPIVHCTWQLNCCELFNGCVSTDVPYSVTHEDLFKALSRSDDKIAVRTMRKVIPCLRITTYILEADYTHKKKSKPFSWTLVINSKSVYRFVEMPLMTDVILQRKISFKILTWYWSVFVTSIFVCIVVWPPIICYSCTSIIEKFLNFWKMEPFMNVIFSSIYVI